LLRLLLLLLLLVLLLLILLLLLTPPLLQHALHVFKPVSARNPAEEGGVLSLVKGFLLEREKQTEAGVRSRLLKDNPTVPGAQI